MKTLKAREKRRAAKAKELERREGSSRREGSDRRKRDGSLRKDGANHDGDGSLLRRESSGRKDGVTREGSSSRRHGSREKRERTSSREHRKHGAQASAQVRDTLNHQPMVWPIRYSCAQPYNHVVLKCSQSCHILITNVHALMLLGVNINLINSL